MLPARLCRGERLLQELETFLDLSCTSADLGEQRQVVGPPKVAPGRSHGCEALTHLRDTALDLSALRHGPAVKDGAPRQIVWKAVFGTDGNYRPRLLLDCIRSPAELLKRGVIGQRDGATERV